MELIFDGRTFEARVGTVGKGGTLSEFKDSKPLSGKRFCSSSEMRSEGGGGQTNEKKRGKG